ncbi:MAG: toxic anion resistance protein [Candidatus Peribacteria bacterium]|jgi:uncharacterized protein YaaN involved in tellurite resistance|nr:toxic anion resistance protein [Candidatus Peribacteria bacterium]
MAKKLQMTKEIVPQQDFLQKMGLSEEVTLNGVTQEMRNNADGFLEALFSAEGTGSDRQVALDQYGGTVVVLSSPESQILDVKNWMLRNNEITKELYSSTKSLAQEIAKISPEKRLTTKKGFQHWLEKLPLVGNSVAKYLHNIETASTTISSIAEDVTAAQKKWENSRLLTEQEKADKITEATKKKEIIQVAMLIKSGLQERIEALPDERQKNFARTQWLFPFESRLSALQLEYASDVTTVMYLETLLNTQRILASEVDIEKKLTVKALVNNLIVASSTITTQEMNKTINVLRKTRENTAKKTAELVAASIQETKATLEGSTTRTQGALATFAAGIEKWEASTRIVLEALPKLDAAVNEFTGQLNTYQEKLESIKESDKFALQMYQTLPALLSGNENK